MPSSIVSRARPPTCWGCRNPHRELVRGRKGRRAARCYHTVYRDSSTKRCNQTSRDRIPTLKKSNRLFPIEADVLAMRGPDYRFRLTDGGVASILPAR